MTRLLAAFVLLMATGAYAAQTDSKIVYECTDVFLTYEFRDASGALTTPTSPTIWVNNRADLNPILTPTSLGTPATVMTFELDKQYQKIIDNSLRYEPHIVTMTWSYGGGIVETKETILYVKNNPAVSCVTGPTPAATPTATPVP